MNSIILAINNRDTLRPLGIQFRSFANHVHDTKYRKLCSMTEDRNHSCIFVLDHHENVHEPLCRYLNIESTQIVSHESTTLNESLQNIALKFLIYCFQISLFQHSNRLKYELNQHQIELLSLQMLNQQHWKILNSKEYLSPWTKH